MILFQLQTQEIIILTLIGCLGLSLLQFRLTLLRLKETQAIEVDEVEVEVKLEAETILQIEQIIMHQVQTMVDQDLVLVRLYRNTMNMPAILIII